MREGVERVCYCHRYRMLHVISVKISKSEDEKTHFAALLTLSRSLHDPFNLSVDPLLLRPTPTTRLDTSLGSFANRNNINGPRQSPFFELFLRPRERRRDGDEVGCRGDVCERGGGDERDWGGRRSGGGEEEDSESF